MNSTLTIAEQRSTTGLQWIRCDGYFSERAHDGEHWIGIKNGTIQRIDSTRPDGAMPTDRIPSQGFITPLLADTHVHFYLEPWPRNPGDRVRPGTGVFEVELADAIGRVDTALHKGIGLLRDMGDPLGINLAVRRHFHDRSLPSPELLVAGPAIHRPGKYGRYLGVMRASVDEIKQTIDDLAMRRQVDFIKLVSTGIVDFSEQRVKQEPQFTPAELTEVVAHAHQHGLKVAAHCSGDDGIGRAIETGVDFIEHGYFITDSQVQLLVTNKVVWTPTLVPVFAQMHPECGWPDETLRSIDVILAQHNRMIERAADLGGAILAGTDAGCPGVEMGSGIRTELACLERSGFRAPELLHMATARAAQFCGTKHYTGKLEVGGPASLGVYARPPWEAVEHLDSLSTVLYEGTVV